MQHFLGTLDYIAQGFTVPYKVQRVTALRYLKKIVIHNIHTTWNFLEHFSDLIKAMLKPTCYKRETLTHFSFILHKAILWDIHLSWNYLNRTEMMQISNKGPFTNYVYKKRGVGGQKNWLFVNFYTIENVNGGG